MGHLPPTPADRVSSDGGHRPQLDSRDVRLDLLGLLARVVRGFVSGTTAEFDLLVDSTLSDIGPMFGVDRAYMFRVSGDLMSNTHEWCAPGVSPEKDNLQDLPVDLFPWWMSEHLADRPVNLTTLDDLPPQAQAEREILQAQSIQSLLALPMLIDNTMYGFVGFDHVTSRHTWTVEEVQVLRIIVGAFARSIKRRELDEQLQLANIVFSNAHEGIFVADARGQILSVNPTFTKITGFSAEEAVGQSLGILAAGSQVDAFHESVLAAIADDGHWTGEMWNRRKDGSLFLQRLTLSGVPGPEGSLAEYVGVFADITVVKQQEERLEQMAYYDPLTKLPNRVLLAHRMQQALLRATNEGARMAVCYLDLDRFKPVNDEYGHEVGDRLLVEVAHRLNSAVRAGDTVSRLGGDEFVLILPQLYSHQACVRLIDRLQARVAEPFELPGGLSVEVSASIGVREVPPTDADPDTLLRQADQALYIAKQQGQGQAHYFDAEHDRRITQRRARASRVAEGLANSQMEVHYQPIVDFRTGAVVSAEALVRWRDPLLGLVNPATWLPLIEEEPTIVDLGEFVLDEALGQLTRWRHEGLCQRINVNVSAKELGDPGFVGRLQVQLSAYPEVPPDALTLEVLESVAVADLSVAAKALQACRDLGVRIALDDFGTGYSSLSYLRQLPVTSLKIDRTFVRELGYDEADRSIVKAMLQLAETFRLTPFAEGVENAEQQAALEIEGCHYGQGFGIAIPMGAEEFTMWARQRISEQSIPVVSG
jgi:diguanylate cyclase (GGDEF)-like protein/PAS domain S-box-containing protein